MDNPAFAKLAGICLVLAIVVVAIFVAGAVLGVLMAFLVPVGLLFTAVWIIWAVTKDFSKEKSDDKH